MDLNPEKNASCSLLGDLFQHVVTDMKVSKMLKTYNNAFVVIRAYA